MNKQTVQLSIRQHISYVGGEVDTFKHQAQGEYIQLSTYDKLTYMDHQRDTIEIKWQYGPERQDIKQIEIRQPQGKLIFARDLPSHNPYITDQGTWDLVIESQTLDFIENDQQMRLVLKYQMSVNEQKLGDYDFQLIFHP